VVFVQSVLLPAVHVSRSSASADFVDVFRDFVEAVLDVSAIVLKASVVASWLSAVESHKRSRRYTIVSPVINVNSVGNGIHAGSVINSIWILNSVWEVALIVFA